jgi:hypothetical protein
MRDACVRELENIFRNEDCVFQGIGLRRVRKLEMELVSWKIRVFLKT